jgi:protein SDA1
MDPATRAALAKALILLRNRGALDPGAALPVWLSLLALPDKGLRALVTQHMVADVKRRNAKGRDERLNRAAQGALRGALDGRGGGGRAPAVAEPRAARCALGVLTDLWRRRVWRDARTANAIAAAALHPDESIALAALKFFLGEDAAEAGGAGSDSDDDGGGAGGPADPDRAAAGPALPSGRDILRMTSLGTASSKKKKKAKLARVRRAVAKAARRGAGGAGEGFAAIQLLHDPQVRQRGELFFAAFGFLLPLAFSVFDTFFLREVMNTFFNVAFLRISTGAGGHPFGVPGAQWPRPLSRAVVSSPDARDRPVTAVGIFLHEIPDSAKNKKMG